MIGKWQRFGEGEPPAQGEGLVFIRQYNPGLDALLGDPGVEVVFAVHRHGVLYEQGGACCSVPYGLLWTSLPHLP